MKNPLPNIISGFMSLISPAPLIGGLEINETDLRFAIIKGNTLESYSLRLPVGVVEDGRVKDAANLKRALYDLHAKITSNKKKQVYAIVNIPDSNIYAQVFSLPLVSSENFKEAVDLNMKMISPLDYESVYSDWERVGDASISENQIEILGAFAPKQVVDEFSQCLKEANFTVVAVEFPALSLARLINDKSILALGGDNPKSMILLRVSGSGLSLEVIRNGYLHFNHFTSWQSATSIFLKDLENLVVHETQRVLNFYTGHWQEPVNDLVFIVPESKTEDKISEIIKTNFSLKIYPLTNIISRKITSKDSSAFTANFFAVLGSALRGLMPRSTDTIISLTGIGTEEEFSQQQIFDFIKFWRNIILASLGLILCAFISVEILFREMQKSLDKRLNNVVVPPFVSQELGQLRDKSRKFNDMINVIVSARDQTNDWSPILEMVKELASSSVIIDRIFIQSVDLPVLVVGRAPSADAVLGFKNALSQDPQFLNVDLPLSSLGQPVNGLVNFTIDFKIKSE